MANFKAMFKTKSPLRAGKIVYNNRKPVLEVLYDYEIGYTYVSVYNTLYIIWNT